MRVIVLPGMDGTGELLAEFAAALAPEFDATIVSYPNDVVLDYPALTALVQDLLPQDQPYALIAESFSGPIAIRLAATKPTGLVGVVLCASFAKAPQPRLLPFAGLLRFVPFRKIPALFLMPLLIGRW